MNETLYYKYLTTKNKNHHLSMVTCSNYEIEKNSTYPEISYNKYLIGYNLHINHKEIYIPLFDNNRCSSNNKLVEEIKKQSIIKTLYNCGLTYIVVECISKYL